MPKTQKRAQKVNTPDDRPIAEEKILTPQEILKRRCLDPLEVMEYFKIGRTTLNKWLAQKTLKVSRIGKRMYFDIEDLENMLDEAKSK